MANKKQEDQDWASKLQEIKQKIPKNKIKVQDEELPEPYEPPPPKPRTEPKVIEPSWEQGKIESDLNVDDPAHILVEKIRSGEVDPADLNTDERFVAIRYLKEEEHYTQDQTAEMLGLSRRTICKYHQRLKESKELELAQENEYSLGAEALDLCRKAAYLALRSGKPEQASKCIRAGISILQDLGLIRRAPTTSQSMQAIYSVSENKSAGYQNFKQAVEGQEINIENVLNELVASVERGELDNKEEKNKK